MYYGTQLSSFSQTPLNVSDTNSGPLPASPTLTQYVFGHAHDLIPSLAISSVIIGWILANFTHRCSFWNSTNAIHNCNYSRKVKQKSNPGGNKPNPPCPPAAFGVLQFGCNQGGLAWWSKVTAVTFKHIALVIDVLLIEPLVFVSVGLCAFPLFLLFLLPVAASSGFSICHPLIRTL